MEMAMGMVLDVALAVEVALALALVLALEMAMALVLVMAMALAMDLALDLVWVMAMALVLAMAMEMARGLDDGGGEIMAYICFGSKQRNERNNICKTCGRFNQCGLVHDRPNIKPGTHSIKGDCVNIPVENKVLTAKEVNKFEMDEYFNPIILPDDYK